MKNKGTNTLAFKLWMYFVVFAVSLFVILWFMQVIFLQSYYSSMKKSEVIKLATDIEDAYISGNFVDLVDNIAYRNSSTVFIFDTLGNIIYTSNQSNTSDSDKISTIPDRHLAIDTSGVVEKILNSPNQKISYNLNVEKLKTELFVYGKLIPNTDACLVIVASIDPIDATTTVVQSQLVYITVIALMIASIISVFFSRRLSRPISRMNDTAKKLAVGNYNIKFEKAGYQEMDDLADTLNYATSELARTDKVKRELIANVSHDLRTPLTMIKAYSEMIRDLSGDNKEKREEHLQVIIDETDRLTRLVNDMMDLSKIESGVSDVIKGIFNFSEVVKSMTNNFKAIYESENCKIILDCPEELYANADRTKIEQVLYNLIGNAINHSGNDNKEIKIKVTTTSKRIKVQVIDNGEGIGQEDLAHIWDRYYKASKSFKRSNSGSGLGLSIVKNILTKHESDFGVYSTVGKGSTFWFDIEKASKKDIKINEGIDEKEQKEAKLKPKAKSKEQKNKS
ncbi:MAG: HAMP domain-containing sensor histidine kinase [Clostridia bacterium]|nr:HAMP domain-containing sensor histidine kinase [Clostridia bacterium]